MSVNIGKLVQYRASVSPGLECYVEPENEVRATYADMDSYSNACANFLLDLGLEKGDRIALLLPNSIELVSLFCGAAKAGLVVVTLNTRLTAPELSFIVDDSGCRVLFHTSQFSDTVAAIRSNADYPCQVETFLETGPGELQPKLDASSEEAPEISAGGGDNLFLMYTSGTTGLPKGVVHTHNSVFTGAAALTMSLDTRYGDRVLMPLPMFHVSALIGVVGAIMRGMTTVCMPRCSG